MRFLPLLFLALLLNASAAERVDPHTALRFPDQILGWSKVSDQTYDDPRYGFSVGYNGPSRRALTLYVYTNAHPAIPTGGDSEIATREMTNVMASVVQAWEKEGAEVKSLLSISPLRDDKTKGVVAIIAAQSIRVKGENRISISAITGYRNRLLKLRYTYPGDDTAPGFQELGGFIHAFLELNAAQLDPFFAACLPKKSEQ